MLPLFAQTPPPPYYAAIFSSQRTWYADFELRIAKVERAYGMHS